MIVEEQGTGFRTGVRFPSGPLIRISRNPAFMRVCGVLIFLAETESYQKMYQTDVRLHKRAINRAIL